jgi:FkbM family methyltransferase
MLELSEHIDYRIFMQGYFDNFILENFILNKHKQIVLIDVGANIGAITISAALQGTKVIAFEPNPMICEKFLANINANPLINNVTLNQMALGNPSQANSEMIDLYVHSGNSGSSSMFRDWNHGRSVPKIIRTRISTIDDYVKHNSLVHQQGQEWILKIDVEGLELNVLEGASKFLNDFYPIIVMEWRHDFIHDPIQSREMLNLKFPLYTFYSGRSFARGILQEFEYDKTEENIVGFSVKSNNPLI